MFARLHQRIARDRAPGPSHELAQIREQLAGQQREIAALQERAVRAEGVLRAVASEEPRNRRRLERARSGPSYEEPFTAPDPLVTVCIPTFDRIELLVERSLPSVLAQTHANLEVLVVGDAAPPAVEQAVAALGDPRVRYENLTHRVGHTDAHGHWLAGSSQARNLGYARARGLWIADFDDDDELRPTAIERVLAMARKRRLEVVYGRHRTLMPDGSEREIGVFPPQLAQYAAQGGLVHRDLRFFAREHVAAAYGEPADWERLSRMLRAGVRIGMLDEIVADLYPGQAWGRPTG